MFHIRSFAEFSLLSNGYTGYLIKYCDEVLLRIMRDSTDEAVKVFEEVIVLHELGGPTHLDFQTAFPFLRATYRNSTTAISLEETVAGG
jgi:hypothetical protein